MDLIFYDIGIMIILAAVFASIARYFRQPMIPAYILAGLLIGPGIAYLSSTHLFQVLFGVSQSQGLIQNAKIISTLSEIGIAFLLFIVGLEIDLKNLKDSSRVTIYGGLLSVVVLFLIGLVTARFMGIFTLIETVYIGMLISFSSTMVVLKILSDRKEIDTLHGRITIGILLVQDIVAILALMLINTVGKISMLDLLWLLLLGFFLVSAAYLAGKHIFPPIFKSAARNQEMLLLTSLSACFVFGILFAKAGFSIAIGAFIAGIVLGNLPYNYEIIGRVKSLRDFFATLFFVSLGLQINFSELSGMAIPFIAFLILLIIIKPFIILLMMFAFGYKKRTSFLTSVSLAQTSEFSLILATQGFVLGHVSGKFLSLAIMLTIFTVFFSSYFLKFENKLYLWLGQDFDYFEKLNSREDQLEYHPDNEDAEVLLIGYSRTGYNIFHKLKTMSKRFILIDFNPEVIKSLIKEKIPCIYGDVANPEILSKIDFSHLKFVISTIPDASASKQLIKTTKQKNKDIIIFVTSYHVEDALSLYDSGADYVILPHFLGGYHASILLEEVATDITGLINTKARHLEELQHRKELGHTYPTNHHDHDKKPIHT